MEIKEFFNNDRFAALAGIELLEVQPGKATAKMEVKDIHFNAGNVVQGGAIFTLADLALGAAVNAYGNLAVSIDADIRYFKSVKEGTLYAFAELLHFHHKLATFQVKVVNEQKDLIALFTSTAYRKDIDLPFKDEINNY